MKLTMEPKGDFDTLLDRAQGYLQARQAALGADYQLWDLPRYDWYQETGQLIFSDEGRPCVIADIQFVGSISTKSDTWLWSWANDSVDPKLHEKLAYVRNYGTERSFERLTTSSWHGHETDGWEMTCIASYLLQAAGAYRTPKESGFTYMVMTNVAWAT